MRFDIEIETFEKSLEFELFETKELSVGETRKSISEDVTVEWEYIH